MRQPNNSRRGRGRGGGRKSNPRNSTFDSNGPQGRVRGTAQQLHEKYLALARDASSAGDRITAESFFQHADHYYRIFAAANQPQEGSGDRQPDAPAGAEGEAVNGQRMRQRRQNGQRRANGEAEADGELGNRADEPDPNAAAANGAEAAGDAPEPEPVEDLSAADADPKDAAKAEASDGNGKAAANDKKDEDGKEGDAPARRQSRRRPRATSSD